MSQHIRRNTPGRFVSKRFILIEMSEDVKKGWGSLRPVVVGMRPRFIFKFVTSERVDRKLFKKL